MPVLRAFAGPAASAAFMASGGSVRRGPWRPTV